jgi:hypothetical protein
LNEIEDIRRVTFVVGLVSEYLKLKVVKRGFIQHCSLKKPIVLLPPDEVPSFISRGAITPSGARALC